MEQEKKPLKISIFDIVIVAAVLAAAVIVFLILKPNDVEIVPSSGTTMEYVVELQTGDALKDGAKNYAIGTVVSAQAIPYTFQVVDEETGTLMNAPMDRYENILVTVSCNMNTSGTAITADSGFTLTVGTQVNVSGPCYSGVGYVISLERGE